MHPDTVSGVLKMGTPWIKRFSKNPAPRPWTEQEILLLELLLPLHTHSEIALRLGRTRNQVQVKCRKLGLSKRRDAAENLSGFRKRVENERLSADVAQLAEYVPECDEDPPIPQVKARNGSIRAGSASSHAMKGRQKPRKYV